MDLRFLAKGMAANGKKDENSRLQAVFIGTIAVY
jgi:hypothetical protein